MPTQEERIAALEQTTVSHIDFMGAINRLALQQAQAASDTHHEVTILLGVIGPQEKDIRAIKADVSTLKADVSTLKADVSTLKADVSTLKTGVGDIKRQVASLEEKFERRFTSLEGKLEQVLQILKTLPGIDK
jgi:predicted  nucleic acid-binding Zn-ribbon protein